MRFDGSAPEIQGAIARAHHRSGHEICETSGGRVLTAAPVPLGDVRRAIEEIEYAYHDLGTRIFWARPNFRHHRNLGDRYYDPVFECLQSLECAFATHEFMELNAETEGSNRFATFTEWHATVHPHEAMLSMSVNGVFERFPRLRCACLEAGCVWVPSWLYRIHE